MVDADMDPDAYADAGGGEGVAMNAAIESSKGSDILVFVGGRGDGPPPNADEPNSESKSLSDCNVETPKLGSR